MSQLEATLLTKDLSQEAASEGSWELPTSCLDICLESAPVPHGCAEVATATRPVRDDSPLLVQEVTAAATAAWRLRSSAACDAELPRQRQLINTLRGSIV